MRRLHAGRVPGATTLSLVPVEDTRRVVAAIAARYHFLRPVSSSLSGEDRKERERAKATLGEHLGFANANEAVTAVGTPRCTHLQFPPNPAHHIATKFINERFSLSMTSRRLPV